MAKRRKKKDSLKTSLKYEVYGILIIIFSVITIADEASVGRALANISGYILGNFYFFIPIFFIYAGLHAMVKRHWPSGWSYRQTGVVLIIIGIVVSTSISHVEQKLAPAGEYSSVQIIKSAKTELNEQLLAPKTNKNIFKKDLGGGYLGALLHALFYFLFGVTGAKLMVYSAFFIGFMLVTGLSYIDMLKFIKKRFSRVTRTFSRRLIELFRLLLEQKPTRKPASRPKKISAIHIPLEDEIDEETYRTEASQRKRKPLFIELFKSDKNQIEADDYRGQDELVSSTHALIGVNDTTGLLQGNVLPDNEHEENVIPLIRDFQDHVMKENVEEKNDIHVSNKDDQPESMVIFKKDKPSSAPYQMPPFHLLSKPAGYGGGQGQHLDYKANARKLEATMESFGVRAKVLEVVRGPSVTRYEIQPDVGVKVSRIVGLTDDIALALAAKDIRMEAPIPGKAAIGIEVPNTDRSIVTMREVMESSVFHESASKLSIVLGRDISGQPIVGNLAKMPHLLVAGATGSGKSVCINGIITSILYKAKPNEVKFLMIDPKMVELNVYNGIPHLLAPVVTDPRRASLALKKVVSEMEKRYELFSKSGTRNIEGYNTMVTEQNGEPLPFIVVIVDELADLMMVAASDVEDAICRLAQMARAAGIHLIIATQRPSVDVITGVIKANIPSRIAFGVSSQVDSRTILDMAGAEKLLGSGDMLFLPVGASKPIRVQGAFLADTEVEAVVNFVSTQEKAEYREEMVPEIDEHEDTVDEFVDELFDQAVQIVLEAKQASVSLLQRRMRIGYTRAARLIDSMEAKGIVGPYEGSKPREVLQSIEQYHHNRISS